ncbi:LysR family transcriptional regulator [Duganella radicis]|uniref:LysR family transcriptional regulator n=1 Tax=Duganella radicis TaxID=551988 RepID=UPI001E507796|nr:LysR family transcriptional regulator [Duganella radicis]
MLRLLVAVYDTGSVTAAAAQLKMSQPAASAALARLRESLGDPLFIRQAGAMLPTPRAQRIIGKTREVIGLIDADILRSAIFDPQKSRDEFVFCLSAIGEIVFLPALFNFLREAAPQAKVRSVSLPPQQLEEALNQGAVDLALGYFPDLKQGNMYQQRLFSHTLVCMVRTGHAIQGARMTLSQFTEAEHAFVQDGGRSQEMFEAELASRKIVRNIVLRTSHYMSIPTIIADSDLVVVLPGPVGNAFADSSKVRVVLPPVEIPSYDLKQHWHRRFHNDPKLIWLRSVVAQLFAASDATAGVFSGE